MNFMYGSQMQKKTSRASIKLTATFLLVSTLASRIKDSSEVACSWEVLIVDTEFPEHMIQIQDMILDHCVNFRVCTYKRNPFKS